jgi:hypothetical protein
MTSSLDEVFGVLLLADQVLVNYSSTKFVSKFEADSTEESRFGYSSSGF